MTRRSDGLRSTDTVYIYTLQSTSKWLWIKRHSTNKKFTWNLSNLPELWNCPPVIWHLCSDLIRHNYNVITIFFSSEWIYVMVKTLHKYKERWPNYRYITSPLRILKKSISSNSSSISSALPKKNFHNQWKDI